MNSGETDLIINISECTFSDIDALCALESSTMSRPWNKANFTAALESDSITLFKAEHGGEIVGYGGVETVDGIEASVLDIAVYERYRRRGVASAILNRILKFCRYYEIKSLWLEVWEGNTPARNLYSKFGFEGMYSRKNYYPEGDAVTMMLRLVD